MKSYNNFKLGFFFIIAVLLASCATTHPNEKLIVGTWRTTSVEKYVDPLAPQQTNPSAPSGTVEQKTKQPLKIDSATGRTGGTKEPGGEERVQEKIDRLIRAEKRAVLVIDSSHIATKKYPGTLIQGTWKMKPNGRVIIAKNSANKNKVRMEIERISESNIVVIQDLPVGALRITYEREK